MKTSALDLLAAALAVRERAYAPYSGYRVGAALRGAGGGIYVGCNVENAAYPQGQCAEAGAIGAMVAAGERRIVEAAVAGNGEGVCSPCGGCRQRLSEFAAGDVPVHLGGPGGLQATITVGTLLPHGFGPANLGGPAAPSAAPPTPLATDAAGVIRIRAGGTALPRIALILGSGLGAVVERMTERVVLDYADLPGFPRPTVAGHAGRAVLGRLGGVPLLCLAGRAHLYEGAGAAPINAMVRTLAALGCRLLLLTNAAGSLRPDIGPGSIVLIDDHINLQGSNPLLGANDEAIGPRFVDLTEVYGERWRGLLAAAAAREEIALARGVYLATLGPAFETPAEIRAFRALGADLVGMSTVPEAISARHAGLEVAALSIVTNLAAGMAEAPLTHAETLAHSTAAAGELSRLLAAALPEIDRELTF
ncbi:MAG: purine-nucleoside phosphorylase [Geminicoccaceae bacterium]